MFDLILVPTDGSAGAAAALAVAELIPSRRVRLLTVEPDVGGPMLASVPELESWRADREREGRAALERAGEPLRRQGRKVETAVGFGDPADLIVQGAAEADADLIVMGSHGRGGGGRFLYGSVADRVARHGPCPTLIVRGGGQAVSAPPLTRVVVPLDGSALAERALPTAAALANDLGLPIHLVRVVEGDLLRAAVRAGVHAAAAYAAAQEAARVEAEAYLAASTRGLRDQDLAATSEVRAGSPAPDLLAVLRPGDLVVLTTHGRGGVRRWLLGSVAEKLVRSAPAAVLLVRPTGGATGAR
jgi:nucleotide-binding universal stress UspA family protein